MDVIYIFFLPLLIPVSWVYGIITSFRNYCFDKGVFKSHLFHKPIISIGNITLGGTGKTPFLVELSKKGIFTIDLEGLANHKGSSFGGLGLGAQPSCEQFENLLAQALHNSEVESSQAIWLEAESANLGKCRIPHKLFEQMKNARVLEITKSKNERIKILVDQYSRHKRSELIDATVNISKRLGPQRTKQAIESIEVGSWADACLAILEYYDKCYEHELKKIEHKETIDLSGLGNKSAIEKLIANDSINILKNIYSLQISSLNLSSSNYFYCQLLHTVTKYYKLINSINQ